MSVIASASKDVKFYQWPEGVLQQKYLPKSHKEYIQTISWGKDGSWIVLVPDFGPIEILSIKNNIKLLHTIQEVYRPSCASFYTTTKKLIGIGTLSGQVMIYDIKGKSIKKQFPRVSSKINSLCYNFNDTHIAATCNNGEILLLNNLIGIISTVYKLPNSSLISSATFHRSKRNLFAASSNDGVVGTWDINSNRSLWSFQAHQASISSVLFSPLRMDLMVTGGFDRKFSFHDLSLHKSVAEIEVNNAITSLDLSNCGVYLAVGFQNGNIAIYDTRQMLNSPLSLIETGSGNNIRHLQFQKVLANAACNSSTLEITNEEIRCTQGGGDEVSPNASLLNYVGSVRCENSNIQDEDVAPEPKCSEMSVDSFIKALGLEGSTNSEATKTYDSVKYRISDQYKKPVDTSKPCTNHRRRSSVRNLTVAHMKTSSTPKDPNVEVPHAMESPIFAINPAFPTNHQNLKSDINCMTASDLEIITNRIVRHVTDAVRQEIQDIVRQEIVGQVTNVVRQEVQEIVGQVSSTVREEVLEIVKQEVADEIETLNHSIGSKIRSNALSLQWSISKEFVNMDMLLKKSE